jgi:phosphatidylserine/phosphatidylglycerophosphate/cardiolipin synthase-like enzyme
MTQISAALSGVLSARRFLPALGRLGAQLALPSSDDSLTAQRAGAERYFERKVFSEAGTLEGTVAVSDSRGGSRSSFGTLSERRAPGLRAYSGANRRGVVEQSLDPEAVAPVYEARTVTYNGHDFPAVALRPSGKLESKIVEAIDAAQTEVVIAFAEFRMHGVFRALRRAKARGVKVRIIVAVDNMFPTRPGHPEWASRRDTQLQLLANEDFDISVVSGLWVYGLQHSKFAVVDDKLAVFGSGRWIPDSEGNEFDATQFSDDPHRVEGLRRFWDYMISQSLPYEKAHDWKWPKTAPAPPKDASLPVKFNGTSLPAYFFSPGGEAEDWTVKAIDAAQESIDVAMFTLRSTRVAEALKRALDRQVKVRLLLDKGQAEREYMKPYAQWLAYHGAAVKVIAGPTTDPKNPGRNNNQFMVIDGSLLQSGSMNWTKNGFSMSFENGHFLTEKEDVELFAAYFADLYRMRRATKLAAPSAEPVLPTDAELLAELQIEHAPLPPAPAIPRLPDPGKVVFNGVELPAAAVRPQSPIAPLIAKAIDATKHHLRIALYEFTLDEILAALRRAKARGVDIEIILDWSHLFPQGKDPDGDRPQRKAQIQALIDEGFTVHALRGAGKYGIMHNKIAVFDHALTLFGSFNWTDTAEYNHFENILFTDEVERVRFLEAYWEWMKGLSLPVDQAEQWTGQDPATPVPADPDLAVEFNGERFPRTMASPDGGIEGAIIRAIGAAKSTIDLSMFTFYSKSIAEALLQAKERGVAVRVVLDASQAKMMKLDEWFAYYGFDVKLLAGPDPHGPWMFEKNHNKFVIVDGRLVASGSYNYTSNAENNNFENVGFMLQPLIAAFFNAFFQMLHDLGWKVKPPAEPPDLGSSSDPTDFFSRAAAGI